MSERSDAGKLAAIKSWVIRNREALERGAFAAGILFVVFMAGLTMGFLKIGPSFIVRDTLDVARELARDGKAYFASKPTKHIAPLRYDETGIVVADSSRMQPGVTFITGLFGNTLGVRLYAEDGALLHEWPINFFDVAREEMGYPFDTLIHGSALMPNGDIIVNLDGRGVMRVSACGEILWRSRDRSHHAVDLASDGTIWTPIYRPRYREERLLPGTTFNYDAIGAFDPDSGEMLREVDIVDAVIASGRQGLVLSNDVHPGDVMHLNDVEVLRPDMADAFPLFEAGDLLLSSRHFNQIWVLDGKTGALKWWHVGSTIGQHDPDFQPDGTITVFDNRTLGRPAPENGWLGTGGGSRIVSIDPVTHEDRVLYQSTPDNPFYTAFRGKHQVQPNGNILITETDAGRVFEVTPEGEIVWSLVNAYDEDEIGWLMGALRYPADHLAPGSLSCDAEAS
ncbi:arylsulfotransferase family protein [Parvularcula lutaonensis]|uniref:Arylsulfotransferase family protein n=1 Tax=Parvularcula lutaonensis TaxID=491923 RepID=A0ABV7M7I2_9PROT|nr:arylsulfotransferase family protein [Parvularcula lutaonensis]